MITLHEKNNKNGIAIPLVLLLATVLTILGAFIYKINTQQYRQANLYYNQIQASYIARSGMEHAIVKVKYLYKELYDAACLAQGRNPLHDFSRPIDLLLNPGPKFCIYQGDATLNSSGYISISDLNSKLSTTKTPPKKWLNTFASDINSLQPVLSMSPLPSNISSKMKFPFTAQYEVKDIEVLAQNIEESGARIKNYVIIKITIEATVNYPKYVAGEQQTYTAQLSRTIKVSRDRLLE